MNEPNQKHPVNGHRPPTALPTIYNSRYRRASCIADCRHYGATIAQNCDRCPELPGSILLITKDDGRSWQSYTPPPPEPDHRPYDAWGRPTAPAKPTPSAG